MSVLRYDVPVLLLNGEQRIGDGCGAHVNWKCICNIQVNESHEDEGGGGKPSVVTCPICDSIYAIHSGGAPHHVREVRHVKFALASSAYGWEQKLALLLARICQRLRPLYTHPIGGGRLDWVINTLNLIARDAPATEFTSRPKSIDDDDMPQFGICRQSYLAINEAPRVWVDFCRERRNFPHDHVDWHRVHTWIHDVVQHTYFALPEEGRNEFHSAWQADVEHADGPLWHGEEPDWFKNPPRAPDGLELTPQQRQDRLRAAESKYKSPADWIAAAQHWIDKFQDRDEAARCLRTADALVLESPVFYGSVENYATIAQRWVTMLDDHEAARHWLNQANLRHGHRESKQYAHDLAQAEFDALGGRDRAQTLMEHEHVAAIAEGGSRLVQCAVSWLEGLGNEKRAAEALDALARNIVGADSLFWNDAEAAKKLLGDGGDRKFMELASSYATTARDHTDCAKAWAIWLDDQAKARTCLQSAAKLAKTCDDCVTLARGWILVSEPREALRCVRRATKLVEDPYQWGLCADIYEELGKRCRAGLCKARSTRKA